LARLRVALTGGIGSGKSTAARYFAKLGVPVFDADQIGRDLVRPGRPAWRAIVERFGSDILLPGGEIDRTKLRRIVFSDPKARRAVEAILHPPILKTLDRLARTCPAPYCLLVIPLLVEVEAFDLADRVLVIDCPEALQWERLRQRGLSEEEIGAILATQASRPERLHYADEVIDNSGTLKELKRQVETLHQAYRKLASR